MGFGGLPPFINLPGMVPGGGSSPWGSYVGGGMAALGGLLGGIGMSSRNFDYDPAKRALARYQELTNMNSPYWRSMLGFYTRAMTDAAPTVDTLYSFQRGSGMTSQGAASLAYRQGLAGTSRAREAGSQAMMRQFLASEDAATKYLGLEYQRGRDEFGGRQGQADSMSSFANQLLGIGGGLLSMAI